MGPIAQVMDFGYPQFTEANILSEFIKTDAHKMEIQARPPMAVTNAVSWRSEGIKYKKNEARCRIGLRSCPAALLSLPLNSMREVKSADRSLQSWTRSALERREASFASLQACRRNLLHCTVCSGIAP